MTHLCIVIHLLFLLLAVNMFLYLQFIVSLLFYNDEQWAYLSIHVPEIKPFFYEGKQIVTKKAKHLCVFVVVIGVNRLDSK